jgi:O-antigen/teichoic acid export membrane protein
MGVDKQGRNLPAGDRWNGRVDSVSMSDSAATLDLRPSTTAEPNRTSARPQPSLRRRVVRGSLWTLGGYGAGQVLRLGSNLILTRLLVPEMFGLMALVNIFIQGLGMFSDVGIGPSIIQSGRGDQPRFLNTAWTIQVMRGCALWLCSCIIAWPVAAFYEQPELRWLIPVAGLSALIAGFNSTALFTLNRHIQLGKATAIELISRIGGIVLMIVWAWYSRSIWPLVGGGLASAAITLALSHTILPGVRNRFCFDREAAGELFRFGRWIFISTVLSFLASQADRLVFGKNITLAELGVYSVAAMMALLPTQAILKVGSSVIFAAYSRARQDGGLAGLADVFSRARLPLLAAGGWAVSFMVVAGPAVIAFLYDHRYASAGWIMQWLAVSAWLQILQVTCGSALLATGATRWVAAGNVAKLVGMLILIPLGFKIHGFVGAVVGIVGSDLLKYAVSLFAVRRCGLSAWRMDLGLTLLTAGAAFLAAGAVEIALAAGLHEPADATASVRRFVQLGFLGVSLLAASAVWAPTLLRAIRAGKTSAKH